MGAVDVGDTIGELWDGLRETVEEPARSGMHLLLPASDGREYRLVPMNRPRFIASNLLKIKQNRRSRAAFN